MLYHALDPSEVTNSGTLSSLVIEIYAIRRWLMELGVKENPIRWRVWIF